MAYVDKLKPGMRELVYEFGLLIVSEMVADGYRDPDALRPVLETWRSRRQQEWLSTNYITRNTGSNMRRIYERALADGQGR
jgi:hypothetical protein